MFQFRLCRELKYAHPDYLLEKLTASQLAEWKAFNTLDPIGEERSDFRMSYMASLLTNLVIKTMGKQGSKLTSVEDFALNWGEGKKKGTQSVEDMKSVFQSLAAASAERGENNKQKRRPPRRKPKRLKK